MKIHFLDLGHLTCDTNTLVALKVQATVEDPNPDLHVEPMPVWAAYIETDHAKILFDSGILDEYDEVVTEAKKRAFPYTHTEEQTIVHQLSLCNVKPEEIDYVVISHMHWDHAGNINKFPNAKVVVQRSELASALMASHTVDPKGTYLRKDCDVDADWMLIDGDFELCEGIKLLLVPGHCEGLQAMQITTENGTMILTSDECYTADNWGPPVRPTGAVYDSKSYVKSMQRLKSIAQATNAKVIFGHDIEQFRSLKKAPEHYE